MDTSVHTVLFLGNSITYAGGYITDVEAWFITRHPQDKREYINMGLPSETVSGLSEAGHAGGRFPRPDLKRPDMKTGLPLEEAKIRSGQIGDSIRISLETYR